MDLPRPLDADVAPSGLLAQRTVRGEGLEIGDSPCGKLAFPMACRGGGVGQEGRTRAGMRLPVCPWPLGTLQAQSLGCEVPNGCVARSTPAEDAGFWPDLGQICQNIARVFHAQ